MSERIPEGWRFNPHSLEYEPFPFAEDGRVRTDTAEEEMADESTAEESVDDEEREVDRNVVGEGKKELDNRHHGLGASGFHREEGSKDEQEESHDFDSGYQASIDAGDTTDTTDDASNQSEARSDEDERPNGPGRVHFAERPSGTTIPKRNPQRSTRNNRNPPLYCTEMIPFRTHADRWTTPCPYARDELNEGAHGNAGPCMDPACPRTCRKGLRAHKPDKMCGPRPCPLDRGAEDPPGPRRRIQDGKRWVCDSHKDDALEFW